jgi:hypothetical protein
MRNGMLHVVVKVVDSHEESLQLRDIKFDVCLWVVAAMVSKSATLKRC